VQVCSYAHRRWGLEALAAAVVVDVALLAATTSIFVGAVTAGGNAPLLELTVDGNSGHGEAEDDVGQDEE
jgi:hypothetical protein